MPFATHGTVKVTDVSDPDVIDAAVAPNSTDPVDAPNPLPAIVTFTPGWPTVGPMDPTCGEVAEALDCQTATVCAGSVNAVTGLLPPDPLLTVIPDPPSSPER